MELQDARMKQFSIIARIEPIVWEQVIENRRKWIERLRAPQAQQFKGRLSAKNPWKSCCLGHACQVLPGLKQDFTLVGHHHQFCYGEEQSSIFLPREATYLLGANGRRGHFRKTYFSEFDSIIKAHCGYQMLSEESLSSINDAGVALSIIADMLEKCLDGHPDSPLVTKEKWEERWDQN
jgi:hypothetical protein